jgi:RNA polymerase sigma factor (sigma-70 family)
LIINDLSKNILFINIVLLTLYRFWAYRDASNEDLFHFYRFIKKTQLFMLTHAFQKDYNSVPIKILNHKNFGLTAAEFENLCLRLREKGDETLIKKIFETQYRPCCELLRSKYGASSDNAHEVVMDVLLKFREDLILGKLDYDNLVSIFKTKSWQNYVKSNHKSKHLVFVNPILPSSYDLDLQQTDDNIAQLMDNEEVMAAFRKAFAQLCERCKALMNRHYTEDLQWKQIAQMEQRNAGAVRVEALECRKKLKSYFQAAL